MWSSTRKGPKPDDEKGKLPGIDRYVRRLFQNRGFPQLDKYGKVYLKARARGKSKNSVYLDGEDLEQHLDILFSGHAIHYTNDPKRRADNHREMKQPKDSFFQRTSARSTYCAWTPRSIRMAASEFEVPAGKPILNVFPNIFDRDILKKHSEYCVKCKDGSIGI